MSTAEVDTDRKPRGQLEADVRRVTDAYARGELKVENDAPFTPHRIAGGVMKSNGADRPPSAGAITNTLKRWRDIGFAEVAEGPLAFVRYTDEAATVGLEALKERDRATKSKGAVGGTAAAEGEEPKTAEYPIPDPDEPATEPDAG